MNRIPSLRLAVMLGLSSIAMPAHAQGREDQKDRGRTSIIVTGIREDDSYAPKSSTIASKIPMDLVDTPQSISVITREQIEDRNFITIGDALQQVAGVTVMPFDGTNPDFRARGFVLDQAYDGIPAVFSSGVGNYDLSIYERVEVLRGPSGLFRGSGSPGGLVNFVRKRGLDSFEVSGAVQAGSWNNYRGELDVGGPIDSTGRLRARAVAGYQDADYFDERQNRRKYILYGALDFDLTSSTTLGLAVTHQDEKVHSPYIGQPAFLDGSFLDYPRSTSFVPDWNRSTYVPTEYTAEIEQRLGEWTLVVRALSRQNERTYRDGFVAPGQGVDPETLTAQYFRRWSQGETNRDGIDAYASGPFSLFGREQWLTLGYSLEHTTFEYRNNTSERIDGISVLDPNELQAPEWNPTSGSLSKIRQSGFHAQLKLNPVEPLTILLGARLSDYWRSSQSIAPSEPSEPNVFMDENGVFTPSGGLVLALTDNLNVYGSYSEIFAPQSLMQANGNTLDPRTGEQWEGGIKGRFFDDKLSAAFAIFSTRERNRPLSDADNPGFYLPAGLVKISGFEVELVGSPVEGLDLNASYSNLKTEWAVGSVPAGTVFDSFEPRHLFKVYARYEPKSLGGAFGSIGMTAQSSVVGSGAEGLREQGAYALVNAQLGYRFNEHLRAFVSVNNLLDKTYYARVGSINVYNNYGEPRNFLLTLRAKY